MKYFKKTVIGLVLVYPATLWTAVTVAEDLQNETLSSYLKSYHTDVYKDFVKKGVDIKALEATKPSDKNVSSAIAPDLATARTARHDCEKGQGGGIFLENNYVATCVSADGTLGNGNSLLGLTFNPAGTGTLSSPDYLRPGSPFEYFSVAFEGQVFTNNNNNGPDVNGSDNIPTNINRLDRYTTLQEGGVWVKSQINAQQKRLAITQKYTLDPKSREIIIRVELQNIGKVAIGDIAYSRGLDPDQDIPGTFNTINKKGHSYFSGGSPVHVKPFNIAWASGKSSKLGVGLYTVDPVDHDTCISRTWTTNPYDVLAQTCGNPQPIYDYPLGLFGSNYSDSTINLAFKVGSLAPTQTKVFSFKYLFDKARKRISPVGWITDVKPTYTWYATPGSSWYHLWVSDSKGVKVRKWFTAEQVGCISGTGTCSVTPDTLLADGSGDWWIQPWSKKSGSGPWSAARNFKLESPK